MEKSDNEITSEKVIESVRAHITAARGGEIADPDLIGKKVDGMSPKQLLQHHFGGAIALMNMYKIKNIDGLSVKKLREELEEALEKESNEKQEGQ